MLETPEFTMRVPSHLYKYRSLSLLGENYERTKGILTDNKIYFPTYTEFNDPFDCNLHVSHIVAPEALRRKFRQLNPDKSESDIDAMVAAASSTSELEKRRKDIRSGIHDAQKNLGILTMSARRDHIVMWSHYADSHRGICLEFAVSDSMLFGCSLTPIIYQKEYPKLNVCDEMTLPWAKEYLSIKSYDWSYEEEWRIIYREHGFHGFPSNELTGVILGARISQENRQMVLACLSARQYPVRVYDAREKENEFGLDIIHFGNYRHT